MAFSRVSRIALALVAASVFGFAAPPIHAQATSDARSYTDAEFQAILDEIDGKLGYTPEAPNDAASAVAEPAPGVQPVADASDPSLHGRVEGALLRLLADVGERAPRAHDIARALRSGRMPPGAETGLLVLLALALVALFLARGLQGRGDLAVCIHYPSELRGTFNVRVSKRRSKRQWNRSRVSTTVDAVRAQQSAAAATRYEHTMVARETHFRELRSRDYCVLVYGFLQPLDSEEVISTHLEEQEVEIRRGHAERLEFDFHPKECTIDVRVLWDRRPVAEALVALRGTPGSVRYARGGPARMSVGQGIHTLVVGSGDRVAEHTLDVQSFQPISVEIDLTGRDNVLFSGCPPAVEPYLHGDLPAAARALEREGQTEVSHLILARLAHERGLDDTAARHYESSGRFLEAAEIHQALNHFDTSAGLFDRAGEPMRAAEMWRAAGEPTRAGEAYERANCIMDAVECYREAEDVSRWTTALERMGAPLEAAQVAIDRNDWGRAIRSLQLVPSSDPEYVTAANLLIDAYQRAGHLDLALIKTEELIHNQGIDDVPLESCDRLARLLEEHGEFERSLSVLEIVRRRDATYPNVATRIELMRKRLLEESTTAANTQHGAFGEESRYEILGELGRGGMGVVFRARDRRLGRVVALKQLPENLRNHPKAVQMFLREARSAAALNHPNIVTVYDAGHEGDALYITMELLEGMPLQNILKARGKLSARDAARLGVQISGGLQYAHEQRIIHRDIKTGNLFFTHSKKIKIMDFGLAKMVEEVRKASTVVGGTPYYMAPEQSLGEAVDHRADLYALGVTFYELVTGEVPFSEGDVAFHHRHTPPPDPRSIVDDLPGAFAELILELMAKAPDGRPESALEVSERLQPLTRSPK